MGMGMEGGKERDNEKDGRKKGRMIVSDNTCNIKVYILTC